MNHDSCAHLCCIITPDFQAIHSGGILTYVVILAKRSESARG